ncbi:MAG: hypothetical protein LBC02_15175 [Planctomycetaceae bacterium]|nr:hypothetical protein [Planctomycetaceae bacterium]
MKQKQTIENDRLYVKRKQTNWNKLRQLTPSDEKWFHKNKSWNKSKKRGTKIKRADVF